MLGMVAAGLSLGLTRRLPSVSAPSAPSASPAPYSLLEFINEQDCAGFDFVSEDAERKYLFTRLIQKSQIHA